MIHRQIGFIKVGIYASSSCGFRVDWLTAEKCFLFITRWRIVNLVSSSGQMWLVKIFLYYMTYSPQFIPILIFCDFFWSLPNWPILMTILFIQTTREIVMQSFNKALQSWSKITEMFGEFEEERNPVRIEDFYFQLRRP